MHLATNFDVQLVEVPVPAFEPAHARHPLLADVRSKHRAEAVPAEAHGLISETDPALEQQVLDVAQAQREAHIHDRKRQITSGDELK